MRYFCARSTTKNLNGSADILRIPFKPVLKRERTSHAFFCAFFPILPRTKRCFFCVLIVKLRFAIHDLPLDIVSSRKQYLITLAISLSAWSSVYSIISPIIITFRTVAKFTPFLLVALFVLWNFHFPLSVSPSFINNFIYTSGHSLSLNDNNIQAATLLCRIETEQIESVELTALSSTTESDTSTFTHQNNGSRRGRSGTGELWRRTRRMLHWQRPFRDCIALQGMFGHI